MRNRPQDAGSREPEVTGHRGGYRAGILTTASRSGWPPPAEKLWVPNTRDESSRKWQDFKGSYYNFSLLSAIAKHQPLNRDLPAICSWG